MSRNASGVYSLPSGTAAISGAQANASHLNSRFTDLESDANTARPIVAGGTGATSASAARTNLGLAIGTDVQAYHGALADLAALTSGAIPLKSGATDYTAVTLGTIAQTVLPSSAGSTWRSAIGADLGGLTVSAGAGAYFAHLGSGFHLWKLSTKPADAPFNAGVALKVSNADGTYYFAFSGTQAAVASGTGVLSWTYL